MGLPPKVDEDLHRVLVVVVVVEVVEGDPQLEDLLLAAVDHDPVLLVVAAAVDEHRHHETIMMITKTMITIADRLVQAGVVIGEAAVVEVVLLHVEDVPVKLFPTDEPDDRPNQVRRQQPPPPLPKDGPPLPTSCRILRPCVRLRPVASEPRGKRPRLCREVSTVKSRV